MHPLLSQDMDLVKQMYGESALSHRLFGTIDDIDIELNIDVGFLDVSNGGNIRLEVVVMNNRSLNTLTNYQSMSTLMLHVGCDCQGVEGD